MACVCVSEKKSEMANETGANTAERARRSSVESVDCSRVGSRGAMVTAVSYRRESEDAKSGECDGQELRYLFILLPSWLLYKVQLFEQTRASEGNARCESARMPRPQPSQHLAHGSRSKDEMCG